MANKGFDANLMIHTTMDAEQAKSTVDSLSQGVEKVNQQSQEFSQSVKDQQKEVQKYYNLTKEVAKNKASEVTQIRMQANFTKSLVKLYKEIAKERNVDLEGLKEFTDKAEDLESTDNERLENQKKINMLVDKQKATMAEMNKLALKSGQYKTGVGLIKGVTRLEEKEELKPADVKKLNESKKVYNDIVKLNEDQLKVADEIEELQSRQVELLKQRKKLEKDIGNIAAQEIQEEDPITSLAIENAAKKGLIVTNKELSDTEARLKELIGETNEAREAADDANKRETKSLAKKALQASLYIAILRQIQQAYRFIIDTVRELDEALTAVATVTTMNRKETQQLIPAYQRLAKNVGLSTTEVTKLSIEFFRQGRSTQEVFRLTELAAKSAKAAGIDAVDAANYLTSAVNGFQLSMQEAELVADRMAALGAQSASSFEELAIALSKVAPAAKVAGVSIDFMLATLAKGVEATREAPENIGTAFKTIFARMRELKDIGKTMEDGMSINRVEDALGSLGIELRDSVGEFRDLEDVIMEVGLQWDSLTRNQQAYIATTLAGTRQQARLIALFENFDRTLELVNVSQDSAGSLNAQFAESLQGMDAAINRVTVSMQALVTTFVNSDVIVGVINGLAKGITIFNEALQSWVFYMGLAIVGITALIVKIKMLGGALDILTAKFVLLQIKAGLAWLAVTYPVAIAVAAIAAVVGVIAGLTVWFTRTADTAENAARKMNEFNSEMDETRAKITEIETKEKTLEGLVNEYDRLREKVFLTNEEMDKLISLQDQLSSFEGVDLIGAAGDLDATKLAEVRAGLRGMKEGLSEEAADLATDFLAANKDWITQLNELSGEVNVEELKKAVAFGLAEDDIQKFDYIMANFEDMVNLRKELADIEATGTKLTSTGRTEFSLFDEEDVASVERIKTLLEGTNKTIEDFGESYGGGGAIEQITVDMEELQKYLEDFEYEQIQQFARGTDLSDEGQIINRLIGTETDWDTATTGLKNYIRQIAPGLAAQFDKIGIDAVSKLRSFEFGDAINTAMQDQFNEYGPEMTETIINGLDEVITAANEGLAEGESPLNLNEYLSGADLDDTADKVGIISERFGEVFDTLDKAGVPLAEINKLVSDMSSGVIKTSEANARSIDLLAEEYMLTKDLLKKKEENKLTAQETLELQRIAVGLGYESADALQKSVGSGKTLNQLYDAKRKKLVGELKIQIGILKNQRDQLKLDQEQVRLENAKYLAKKNQLVTDRARAIGERRGWKEAIDLEEHSDEIFAGLPDPLYETNIAIGSINDQIRELQALIGLIEDGDFFDNLGGDDGAAGGANKAAKAFDALRHSIESLMNLDILKGKMSNIEALLNIEGLSDSFVKKLEREQERLDKAYTASLQNQLKGLKDAAEEYKGDLTDSGIVAFDEFGKAYITNYEKLEKMHENERDELLETLDAYNDYTAQMEGVTGELIAMRQKETDAINKEYEERKDAVTEAIDAEIEAIEKAFTESRKAEEYDLKAKELSDKMVELNQNIAAMRRDDTQAGRARLEELKKEREALERQQRHMAEERAKEEAVAALQAKREVELQRLEEERTRKLEELNGSMGDLTDIMTSLNMTMEETLEAYTRNLEKSEGMIASASSSGQSYNALVDDFKESPIYQLFFDNQMASSENAGAFTDMMYSIWNYTQIAGGVSR